MDRSVTRLPQIPRQAVSALQTHTQTVGDDQSYNSNERYQNPYGNTNMFSNTISAHGNMVNGFSPSISNERLVSV